VIRPSRRELRTAILSAGAIVMILTAGALHSATDVVAPRTPRELKGSADGPHAVDLDWRRSNGSDGYYVYRDGNRIAETNRSDYRDEDVEPTTTYEYRVSAFDNHGESDLSDPVQVTTDFPPGPTVPANLAATAVGSNRIDLAWSPSEAEAGVAFYRVWRDGDEVATTGDTIHADSDLLPETRYEYRVSAVDELGTESDRSDVAAAATLAVEVGPPPPENLAATVAGPTQIDLTWSPPSSSEGPIDGYNVYRNGSFVAFIVHTLLADTDLEPGTTYRYAVSSVNDEGLEGERSVEVSATTDDAGDGIPPAAPTGLRLVGG